MKMKHMLAVALLMGTISFTACKPKDADVKANIEKALSSTPGVAVSVTEGVVTLSGEVADEAAKAAAETAAKAVKGVKSVENSLTVPPPPPPVVIAVDDALTTAVKAAIAAYSTVSANVADGVVTLNGEIKKSELSKLMAAIQALKPKKVENKLTIK